VAATAWYWKAWGHEALGDTSNALRSYDRALKYQPDFASASYAKKRLEAYPNLIYWYQAADSAAANEEWTESRDYFFRIVEIDSAFKDAQERLQQVNDRLRVEALLDSAFVLKNEGTSDSVFAMLRRARDLAPEKSTYIDSIIENLQKETAKSKIAEGTHSSDEIAGQPEKTQTEDATPVVKTEPPSTEKSEATDSVSIGLTGRDSLSGENAVETPGNFTSESQFSIPVLWIAVGTLISGTVVFALIFLKRRSRSPTADLGRTWTAPVSWKGADIGSNPEVLQRYRIEEEIGEGGMGKVYKAFDTKLERAVALKTIRLDQVRSSREAEERIDRFRREAKATASLNHPNIVNLYDYDERDGVFFMTMEYVEGATLRHLLDRNKKFTIQEALHIIKQSCLALQYAHERELIHRDIKPSNIALSDEGLVKVLDFGIAKILSLTTTLDKTKTGLRLGSPLYMSPEQIEARPLDGRSDIYSLGVVLHEILTGQRPYGDIETDSMSGLFYAIMNRELSPIHESRGDIPVNIDELISKMTAKRPEDRFESVAVLLEKVSSIDEKTV